MTQSEKFQPASLLRSFGVAAVAGFLVLAIATPSEAQRRRDNDEEAVEGRVLTSAVGERVLEAQECEANDDDQCVVRIMTQLASGSNLSPYERSIVLRLRALAYYRLEQVDAAIRDFNALFDTGALITDEIIQFRTALGQIYLVQGNVSESIRQFELAIAAGAQLTPTFSYSVAQAYLQAERYRDGVRYAEIYYNGKENKSEGDYSIMQFFYQQLERPADEERVVRDYLNAFPGSRTAWQNLVALFAQQGDDQAAFEANKLMYLNGLFREGNELLRLAQYYSYFENPYRGASILQREINAGRVEGSQRNLELLANMWRQAAEFESAIPVLERLSEQQGDGETALRLAEAHYQLNNFADAESALEVALERGGLSDTGQAWELLGNIRFSLDDRTGAIAAFEQGARFPRTRTTSNNWIRFVRAQIAGEAERARQREQVQIEECGLTIDAERRSLVLIGDVDADGRVRFPEGTIPERCLTYFEPLFGEQYRQAGMTNAEAEAALADLIERREAAEG